MTLLAWLFGLIVLIFVVSYLYAQRQGPVPDDETMTAATLAIAGEGNVRGCVRAGSDP